MALRKAYLNTMQGLEAGLKVRDIAVYDLSVAWIGETVGAVQRRVAVFDFDNVPVRSGAAGHAEGDGPVIGVVENLKALDPACSVGDCMTSLGEHMLISGDVSLVSFLPRIADRDYRLVLGGERVTGFVTPSDVVQLPVRLLVFALLVHLEETMRSLLRWRFGDEDACAALSPQRQTALERTLLQLRRSGLNPLPLDATQFSDKAAILFEMGLLPDREADRETFRVFYELRNAVDHARPYAENPDALRRFLAHVVLLEDWIERLTRMFPPEALKPA